MFTEGLDLHEIQWIQERTDQVHNLRNDRLDSAILPPEEFRGGHLPGNSVPLSRKIPVDVSSVTEEEREIPNGATGVAPQYHYGSDGYSNLSSSVDAVRKPVQQQWKKESMSDYTNKEEEGSSESWGSSSLIYTNKEDIYSSKGRHSCYESTSVDKGFPVYSPSAPPFHGSHHEINQAIDPATNLTSCDTPHKAAFNIYSTKNCTTRTNSGSKKVNRDIGSPSIGIETSAPSKFFPLKAPTFHACEQGPWHSVIAYDACVRLCLHLWARGCMSAPIFLENECSLLRSSFGRHCCNQRRNSWKNVLQTLLKEPW